MVYSDPSIDIKNLIENGYIVVVDTNILLGLYRFSPDYANFALKCLEKVKPSLMLPDTVVIEFKKHHTSMYQKRKKSIENSIEDSLKMVRQQKNAILNSCGVLKTRNFPEIDDLLSTITSKYEDVERAMHDYFDDHSVLSLINDTWTTDAPDDFAEQLTQNHQKMEPFSVEKLYNICEEGEKRYKKETPPGYKDAKKKDGVRKYSDLIMWKEIMNYACQKRKNIIFVTDDVKCDWWEIDNGKCAFHDALITEFHRESKVRPSSELGKALVQEGKSLEHMEIVPFISTDFYKAVSSSYQIPIEDAIAQALVLTDDSYIETIKENVFDKIIDELAYSGTEYLDETMTYVGDEGIDEWEVYEYNLFSSEIEGRVDDVVTYRLSYEVRMSGCSYDYWGRDDVTKEVMLSSPYRHEVEGTVSVLVNRKVDMLIDFEDDADYESVEIESAEFSEAGYHDCYEDVPPLPGAYMECGRCGCQINEDNDAGTGRCIDCERETDD